MAIPGIKLTRKQPAAIELIRRTIELTRLY